MSMTLFKISATPLPPQRFWTNTGRQRGAQCGNLTVGAGANLFSHSLDPKPTLLKGNIRSANGTGSLNGVAPVIGGPTSRPFDKACLPVGQVASVANATYQGLTNR